MTWTVYVLASEARAVTYVGIALDVERRLLQHNGELKGGARSTRAGRPWQLAASYGPYPTRGEAQRAEHQVKLRRGSERLAWHGELGGPE
jgi:putative endonuclease